MIIDRTLLKEIILKIGKLFMEYKLSPMDMKLVISEMKIFTDMVDKDLSEKSFKKATKITDILKERMLKELEKASKKSKKFTLK